MEWMPGRFPLQLQAQINVLQRHETQSHPLNRTIEVKELESSGPGNASCRTSLISSSGRKNSSPWVGLDPLSAALSEAGLCDEDDEPVQPVISRRQSSASQQQQQPRSTPAPTTILKTDEEWNSFRNDILNRHTTSEKLTLKSSFLSVAGSATSAPSSSTTSAASASKASSLSQSAGVSVSDQVKNRLQQLDDIGDVRIEKGLTQREFTDRMDQLNKCLIDSWNGDQRVKALKIVIQVSKMLSDVSVLRFYPCMFSIVCEILDQFGSRVYDRISERSRLSSNELARETCRNWLYKISSIREIIPRFLVEVSILRTCAFLFDASQSSHQVKQMSNTLQRLSLTTRGIADPLVASYARAYLCRIACKLTPANKAFFKDNLIEIFLLKQQFNADLVHSVISKQKISRAEYFRLITPSLVWISKCLMLDANIDLMHDCFSQFKQLITDSSCHELNDAVLTAIVSTFKPAFIVTKFDDIMSLMQVADPASPAILMSLGSCFSAAGSTSSDNDSEAKLNILKQVWSKVSVLQPKDYLSCAAAWVEFVVKNFAVKEINSFLKDIQKHMESEDMSMISGDNYDANRSIIISKMFQETNLSAFLSASSSSNQFNSMLNLLSMDSLQPFVQTFRDQESKVSACNVILTSFFQHHALDLDLDHETDALQGILYSDVLHNLSIYCKTIHDSLSAVSLEDEKRSVSQIITNYLKLVTFCPVLDQERKFSLLQDARADFYNIDQVLSFLSYAVNSLIACPSPVLTPGVPQDFVRSCLAYSFTTIPSIEDPVVKLHLYCYSAEMALAHSALSQLDTFLKSGLTLLSHLPSRVADSAESSVSATQQATSMTYDSFFASYCKKLLTILLLVPDHPDHEPLYLLKGLVNVVQNHEFENEDVRYHIYLDIMTFLSIACQPECPFRCATVQGIDTNNVLYSGDEEFVQDVNGQISRLLQLLLQHLSTLTGDEKRAARQSEMCLQLFTRLLAYSDLSQSHKLLTKLWNLMRKFASPAGDRDKGKNKFYVRMKDALRGCPDDLKSRIMSQ